MYCIVHLAKCFNCINLIVCNNSDTYESGMSKVKLAEKFSDIDSSDVDNTSKKSRRIRLTKSTYSDEDDSDVNDWQNTLPPPPKKPVSKTLSIIKSKNNKPMEDTLPLETGATRKNSNVNTLQSVQDISKKHPTEASVSKDNNSAISAADIGI